MGLGKCNWMALAIILACVVLCVPATAAAPSDVTAETPSSSDQKSSETAEETDEEVADAEESESLPPLDLGLGATAKNTGEEESPADILADGITVTSNTPSTAELGNAPKPDEAAGAQPPLWTPNSGRFLLKDRQADLSLTANGETTETIKPPST